MFSAADCRLKWQNLRNSYRRYVRDVKYKPSGSGASNKKKWYLADCMSFLDNFINKHKPMESNMSTDDVDEEIIEDSDVVRTESNHTYISET